MNRARRIRSENLGKHQYKEGYGRYLQNKKVKWNNDRNFEQMCEQVKWTIVDSTREVWLSKGRGKTPKECMEKAAIERKEASWKEVLRPKDEFAKKDIWKFTKKKKEMFKDLYIISREK